LLCPDLRRSRAHGDANASQLVFTDTSLPDSTWADVVKMANEVASPVDVIVVGAKEDMGLYVLDS
jgi:hypothetical protein